MHINPSVTIDVDVSTQPITSRSAASTDRRTAPEDFRPAGHDAPKPTRMERLGSFVVERRRMVVVIWVAVVLVTGLGGVSQLGRLSTDFGAGDATESGRVAAAIDDMAGTGGEVAIIADGVDASDPDVAERIGVGLAEIGELDDVIAVTDPWTTTDPATAAALTATDGRAALAVITLAGGLDDDVQIAVAERVAELARDIDAPEVIVGGQILVGEQFATASENDLLRGEAIALPIAIVVMVFLLGGLVAAGMPLLVALSGIVTSLAVLGAATYIGDVSIFSLNVVNMLGLGLGIDYGLLIVNRYREERSHGLDVHAAVKRTVATAGTTVIFSALTVAVAMSGLFLFGIPLLASFGLAGLGVVLLCMISAVTLLPAVMAMVGARIKPAKPAADGTGRFYRIARFVQGHAGTVTIATVVVLVGLATPFLGARFENGDARSLPRSAEVRDVALTLADRFPSRGADPITVIANSDPSDPTLVTWLNDISTDPSVASASIIDGTPAGTTVIDITPTGTSQDETATGLVEQIRTTGPAGLELEVGGPAAELIDVENVLTDRLPWALAAIVSATLVLLFLMTGSIIVPIKAVIMNVLSLGASFGALVWIFQDGNLSGVLAFDSVGAIDLWMPILVLIFAFGLSMDYEVFLLSRIKEIHDQTGDNDRSVALGMQHTGRIITSAALLIVVVFAGFAAGEVLAIKQLGVGLAVAVIVDATIVRMLLVPATMRLLGERNWWAPAPLRRFHQRFGLHEAPSTPNH